MTATKSGALPNRLMMVTTTKVPYLYHVPSIVGTPHGLAYWFRYLKKYLHPSVLSLGQGINELQGTLYVRDDTSSEQLCYPFRHFEVQYSDLTSTVCFLTLKLGDLVSYEVMKVPGLPPRKWSVL